MAEKFEYFELVFANPKTLEKRPVRFLIEEHDLAQRWAVAHKDLLLAGAHLEKNYLFHGWVHGDRNLQYLCDEMNRQIAVINKFFNHQGPDLYYRIDQVFTPSMVNQDELNRIHKDFELLIGQVWDVSKYYANATPETQHAIRQINNICHETEAMLLALRYYDSGGCCSFMIGAMFPKRVSDLLPEDRRYFRLFSDFGDVNLHYAQLGKNHLEAFYSNDEIVADKNITSLRYLSGEFDIHFGDHGDGARRRDFQVRFYNWAREKGINPAEHNIGFAKVAGIDRSQFPGCTDFEVLKELHRYTDVCEIRLGSSQQVYRAPFTYLWSDDGVAELQTSLATQV